MTDILSEGILLEFLKRLPVKSLLRFTSVKKSWYHLIKSRYFKALYSHNRRNNDNSKYLLFYAYYPSRLSLRHDDKQCKEYCPQLQFPVQEKWLQIYGISNGLICLSTRIEIKNVMLTLMKEKLIYLWNPVIRKFKTLPVSPVLSIDQLRHIQCYCSRLGLAFGYFDRMDDYKVIIIATYCPNRGDDLRPECVFVYVYSLSTNSWKTIRDLPEISCYQISSSVVIYGDVYWLGEDVESIAIVCFEVENEKLRHVKLPQRCMNHHKHVALVREFGEKLSLFYFDECTHIFDMWVLEKQKEAEMNEAWIKKVTLDLNQIDGRLWPIGFRNNGEIVLENMKECGFLSYDVEKGETTEIVEDALELWYFRRAYIASEDVFEVEMSHHTLGRLPTYAHVFEEDLVLLGDDGPK